MEAWAGDRARANAPLRTRDLPRDWRLAAFVDVGVRLAGARSVEAILVIVADAARALARAHRATVTVLSGADEGRTFVSGVRAGLATSCEREIAVGARPFARLVVQGPVGRRAFDRDDDVLLELLCIESSMAVERAQLQDDEALLGRVRELLYGPGGGGSSGVRELGDVRIDLLRNEVSVGGAPVHLTPSEYRLLVLLSDHPGSVYGRPEIVSTLWSSQHVGSARSCDSHVVRLRHKLRSAGARRCRIATVRGAGYRLDVGA